MKIINFCTKLGGGAGNAAENFHLNLINNGNTSILFNANAEIPSKSIYCIQYKYVFYLYKLIFKIFNFFKFYKKDFFFYYNIFQFRSDLKKLQRKIKFQPDAIVLHSIQNFLTLNDLIFIKKLYNVKIYWMIYDMGPFTGGCHYSWDCSKYYTNCSNCEAANYFFLKNLSNKNLFRKKKFIDSVDLIPLPHSKYLLKQIEKSYLFKNKKKYFLSLGYDKNIYSPIKNLDLRKKYNLIKYKRIFLFATPDLMTKRKGIHILKDSLKFIDKEIINKSIILTLGNLSSNFTFGKNINHIHFNSTASLKKINEIYNLTDVFLSPAIEDSGNSMLIQALFTECPYVSFNIAFGSDLKDYNIGYVSNEISPQSFSEGIKYFFYLNDQKLKKLSKNCRKIAIKMYNYESQINNFKKIMNINKISK